MDRLSPRTRPPGTPLMLQRWGKLLFLHWPLPPQLVQPLLPPGLELDTWEGEAWCSVTPFSFWGTRPPLLPAVPYLSASHELNVRTYVHRDGVPGVWFLSLDASNVLAVIGARLAYHLPYYQASMRLDEEDGGRTIRFRSRRTHADAPAARFEAHWRRGAPVAEAEPGSLSFFLVERYWLYAARRDRLHRARIHHRPWPLADAELLALSSTMLEAHGLPTPERPPLLHAQAEPFEVEIWPLERIAR